MTLFPDSQADSAQTLRRVVRFELSPRTMLVIVAFAAGALMLVRLVPVILVLAAALMLVGALNPLVGWLETRKIRRSLAIGIVFGLAVGLVALGLFVTLPALVNQVQTLVEHEPDIRGKVADYLETSPMTRALSADLRDVHYGEIFKNSRATLLTASMRAVEIVAYALAAIFLALYIMVDRDRLRGALFSLVPRKHHVRASRIMINLETIVGGYIRGQVITCSLITGFILIVLLSCRVPNALALAVFGGAMDLLPYIGALLTIVPAVAAAYVVSPMVGGVVFGLLLLYEEFESRLLTPLVYGRALRLPSSVVFLSLLVGGALGGVVGALLALPIAATLLMLLEELRVDLPGESAQPKDVAARREDEREEKEYEQRAETASATEASAIAVEIARERRDGEASRTELKAESEPAETIAAVKPAGLSPGAGHKSAAKSAFPKATTSRRNKQPSP
jgi:predicted PurR-regulated permease PerM